MEVVKIGIPAILCGRITIQRISVTGKIIQSETHLQRIVNLRPVLTVCGSLQQQLRTSERPYQPDQQSLLQE